MQQFYVMKIFTNTIFKNHNFLEVEFYSKRSILLKPLTVLYSRMLYVRIFLLKIFNQ